MTRPLRADFLPFGKPVLEEAEIAAVVETLRSGWLSTGPRTAEFQRLFADYVGLPDALGLASATAGLFIALKLLRIGPGDEVIVPPLTFAATANTVVHCGARPVFADVDATTGLLTVESAERAMTPRTKAIVPVHLYGQAADPKGFQELGKRRDITIIADCAHATETRVNGEHVACFADFAAFSFYATKNLAVGEGGMLLSRNVEAMKRAAVLSLHGMSHGAFNRYSTSGFKLYDVIEAGYKFNMTDISAALGIEQLKRIDRRLERRTEIWRRYDEAFRGLPVITPPLAPSGVTHARHLYTLRAADSEARRKFIEGIQAKKIGCGVHFIALHLHSFYREKYGTKRGDYPNAEAFSETLFSIPMTPYLTDDDVEDIIAAVAETAEGL